MLDALVAEMHGRGVFHLDWRSAGTSWPSPTAAPASSTSRRRCACGSCRPAHRLLAWVDHRASSSRRSATDGRPATGDVESLRPIAEDRKLWSSREARAARLLLPRAPAPKIAVRRTRPGGGCAARPGSSPVVVSGFGRASMGRVEKILSSPSSAACHDPGCDGVPTDATREPARQETVVSPHRRSDARTHCPRGGDALPRSSGCCDPASRVERRLRRRPRCLRRASNPGRASPAPSVPRTPARRRRRPAPAGGASRSPTDPRYVKVKVGGPARPSARSSGASAGRLRFLEDARALNETSSTRTWSSPGRRSCSPTSRRRSCRRTTLADRTPDADRNVATMPSS